MTYAVVGQLSSPSGYFRTQEDGHVQFGVLDLAVEHPGDVPLRLEHDLSLEIGRVLYIERHGRAGVWCVAALHDGVERRLDLSVGRYFSAGGRGTRKHRTRPDVGLAQFDLQRFTMDEVSLVDDPAVSVGAVRFVPFDFTALHAGGWPNDFGHHARAVLTRALAAVRAEARASARRRSLVVHTIEELPPTKAVAKPSPPTPNLAAVRAMLAGEPIPAPAPTAHPAAAAAAQRQGEAHTHADGARRHVRRNIGRILRVS